MCCVGVVFSNEDLSFCRERPIVLATGLIVWTTLASNSIDYNLVLQLEAQFGGKIWPVRTVSLFAFT